MKISANTISRLLVSATVVVLMVLAYISYVRIKELIEASEAVNNNNLVRLELQKTYSYFKNGEAGQRGYLLTHDSLFLDQYKKSFVELEQSLGALDTLLRDNPHQLRNLDTLKNLVGERFIIMAKIMDTHERSLRDENADANTEKINLLEGRNTMGVINNHMNRMVDEQTQLLSIQETLKIERQSLAPLLTFILAIFSLLIVLSGYFKINKELAIKTRMQKELEQKNLILQQTNKELEHFAFGASHDLQEPLRKIETFISMLQARKSSSDPEQLRLMDKVQNSVVRMRSLVSDLLNYAHFFYTSEENKPISLQNLVYDVMIDSQTLIEERNARFEIGELPTILGIRPQIYRLLQNLIGNAIKYSKPGDAPVIKIYSEVVKGIDISGILVSESSKLFYKITIEDNGIGFEDQYKEKIFEMFQRLHNKNQYSGSGIGLAICKKVVQNHGGYIEASSVQGQGSKFQIYLPAHVIVKPSSAPREDVVVHALEKTDTEIVRT